MAADLSQPLEALGDGADSLADVDRDEIDSAYGEGESVATNSLRTSALRYEWKHGRRYHGYHPGSYNFPNDEREQDRLDLIHHVFFRAVGDRLFLAPIDPDGGLRILDVGTGTGIWPIHLGDLYPGAALIVGNDLSPIQPQWVPPNVKFVVDDVEADWVESERYDYIHCRYLSGSIKDWPRLVLQIHDHLAPGGWAEFHETVNLPYHDRDGDAPGEDAGGDGSSPAPDSGNKIMELMRLLKVASERIGRAMDPAPSIKGWVEDAGFRSVRERRFKLPVGTWPKDSRMKEIGTLMRYNLVDGTDAFTAALFREVLGWSEEDVAALNACVQVEARRRDVHLVYDMLVITAQKPL